MRSVGEMSMSSAGDVSPIVYFVKHDRSVLVDWLYTLNVR